MKTIEFKEFTNNLSKKLFYPNEIQCVIVLNQRAVLLTITPKLSFERNQNFNDVWRHRYHHQSLSMTIFVIVISICPHRHHHFFIIFPIIFSFKMSFWYVLRLKMKKNDGNMTKINIFRKMTTGDS